MAQKTKHFLCPVCGQHAPIERITEEGPFEFSLFEKILGGKTALTDEEKERQISRGYRRFRVPGGLEYHEVPMDDESLERMKARLEEAKVE